MRSAILWFAALGLAVLAWPAHSQDKKKDPYADHIAATKPRTPAEERKAFQLPPGFEAQLVASEPDIHKPLNLAFDDAGRLWVTETVEYPYPAPRGRKARDAVKVLSDFAPNGKARKITTFADGLNIPIGVIPLPGTRPQDALVHSIPSILRLRDTRGTGKADERTLAYARFAFRDTHGMTSNFTWGFDGWIYACHGYANTSTVKGKDRRAITMNSGNTYRMRADGSTVQQWTWGQVNPFGLTFDPLGNLYSADCHSQPIYQLLRGGYYPSFGKPHDGLGFAPEMFTNYRGSTAISGIAYYAADNFPASYRDTVFIGDVVTNEIVQFRLTWQGSSPRATQHPFLRSKDPWFRPVNILLGPDGALYVADFYNRIIGHYEVPLHHPGRDRKRGRIWRIVYTGKDGKGTSAPRTDWTKAKIADLVKDLRHPNITVRFKATNQLVARGGKKGAQAVRAALDFRKDDAGSIHQRAHGLWVMERCKELDEATLEKALKDQPGVRVHALAILGERATITAAQRKAILACLKHKNAHVQRAAADALGRHPSADNLRPLLDVRHAVPSADTHLLHVVRMALRDQLRSAGNWKVLDKLEGWSERDQRAIADVSLGVPAPEAARYLMAHIQRWEYGRDPLVLFVHHIARHGDSKTTRALLTFAKGNRSGDVLHQVALFRAIERGTAERGARLGKEVRAWAVDLAGRCLAARDGGAVQAGLELTGLLRLKAHEGKVIALAKGRSTPDGQRKAALNALAAIDARRHASTLGKVLADDSSSVDLREHAALLLSQANQKETRAQLVAALLAAPARLQNVIATGMAGSREGAEQLLEAVSTGKASARLLQERAVYLRLERANPPKWKERVAKLTAGLPAADKKMQALLDARRKGFLKAKKDVARGAKVYEKSCAICHQIGGKGAKIGPQLDGIGLRGLERLLEDTLDPNRNVDQAFRSTTLTTKKGKVISGLLLKEEGAVLVLADAQGKEVRVAKKDVEERSVSQLSPMPANFAEQIAEADFYHLMAYLLAQKPAGK
jgi:putative heme-binding domain-containing protein